MKKLTKAEQKAEFITGDYKDLKDFAIKNNIEYTYLRRYAASENWIESKSEHIAQLVHKVVANDIENRVEDAKSRKNSTLEACDLIRKKGLQMIKSCNSEKGLNALASAMYRLNAIESELLHYQGGGDGDAKERLNEVIIAFQGAVDGSD